MLTYQSKKADESLMSIVIGWMPGLTLGKIPKFSCTKALKLLGRNNVQAPSPEQRPGAEQCNCEADKYLPREYQQATRHDVPLGEIVFAAYRIANRIYPFDMKARPSL